MNNNISMTLFDHLAIETILDMFEYLSYNDIIYAFFYFNQRLNSIILQYQRCLNKFKTPIKNFHFWKNILPIIGSNIEQFIITSTEFSFSLNLFPNLKSIIISPLIPIHYDDLNFLLENQQFSQLISFKIKSTITYQDKSKNFDLIEKIFNNGYSLETFECMSILDLDYNRILYDSTIYTNIRSLSLKSYKLMTGVSFIKYTPKLKSYNLILADPEICNKFCESVDFSSIKLENFSLTFELEDSGYGGRTQIMYGSDFVLLMNFLKQFSSSLMYLSLDFSCIKFREIDVRHFDENEFRREYIQSMARLKKIYFYTESPEYTSNVSDFFNNILDLKYV